MSKSSKGMNYTGGFQGGYGGNQQYESKSYGGYGKTSHHMPSYQHAQNFGGNQPNCYNKKTFVQGQMTCSGRPSQSRFASEEERYRFKVANGVNNLARGACKRVQPNYVSKSGNQKGRLSRQGYENLMAGLQKASQQAGIQFNPAPCNVSNANQFTLGNQRNRSSNKGFSSQGQGHYRHYNEYEYE